MAKPGKKKKVLFVLEIIVLLLFIGGLYVYGQISSRLDKIEQPELKKEKIVVNQEAPKMTGYKTYVLFGIDTRGEGSQYSAQNSDTMIIVSVNNDTKEVRMVSVYRDTLLNVGDDTYTKANAAYALGGPEQAITMLNTNLDLDISDYAKACRFKDCKHINEPGCAVLEAVNSGLLDAKVYESYLKLRREAWHFSASEHEKRKKEKSFTKLVEEVKKRKANR